jgi:hypothetical protein
VGLRACLEAIVRRKRISSGNGTPDIQTVALSLYEGVSQRFRTESIMKYTFTFGITHCCPRQSILGNKKKSQGAKSGE